VNLTFSEKDFVFLHTGEGYDIYMPDRVITYERDTIVPAIPFFAVSIPLDTGKEFLSYSSCISDSLIKESLIINSVSSSMLTSSTTPLKKKDISYPNGIYPSVSVIYSGTHTIREEEYVDFLISPFRYDAYAKKLYLNKTIDISIVQKELPLLSHDISSFNGSVGPIGTTAWDRDSYRRNDVIDDHDYEYIIITCDSLKPAFQKLAYWKTMKGLPTTVLTTEEIYSQYENGSSQVKIKSALKDYYNGHHQSLQYALLGGDTEFVPAQFCHVFKSYYNSVGEHYYDRVDFSPVDWYYGCFGTMEWDTNNNGWIGETDDNVDIAAEIVVSRFPAKSLEEANAMVERIVQYEKQPPLSVWNPQLLMCGNLASDSIVWGGEKISDMHAHYEIAHQNMGFPSWNGNVVRFFDTGTDFVGGRSYDLTTDHLQTELSKGYTIVSIDTHGADVDGTAWDNYFNLEPIDIEINEFGDTVEIVYGTYDYNDAESLINAGNTILITSACHSNRFDDSRGDCLGEAFMRNPQGGILAYIGSSRKGWNPASLCINKKVLQELFNGTYKGTLGKAFWNAKNNIVGLCATYDYGYRWLLFSVNMLGDPEMPVFISAPCKLDSIKMSYRDDELFIMNNPYDSIAVCVMSRDDAGATFYRKGLDGTAGFSNSDDEQTICITKKGYIPYIGTFAPTVYLQKDNILHDFHVFCNNTVIGNNVTSNRDTGPFTITKGKTTINSLRGVTINDSFEIKLGAELEIVVDNP